MMLLAEATPAQIGASLIAHPRIAVHRGRIGRGMLDASTELGPKLQPPAASPAIVFGVL